MLTVPCLKDESQNWRDFCYMLLAALSILTLLFAVYVIISQVHMHRIHASYKLANSDGRYYHAPSICNTTNSVRIYM